MDSLAVALVAAIFRLAVWVTSVLGLGLRLFCKGIA
jgi:hypothetical protein